MRTFGVAIACFIVAGGVFADDRELGKEQIQKWGKYYATRAAEYDIRVAGDAGQALTFHKQPVLRWSNPVISNGSTHGECFLWTKDGRPEVFASLFSYRPSRATDQSQRIVAHVFNTVSTQNLIAGHGGTVFWNPVARKPEEFLTIPDAPTPAHTRAARLVQMRRLARQFTATSGGTGNDEELDLRLLPQPVFRFAHESDVALDGALFVFVTGTDPELLLMIEARRQEQKPVWQAIVARHSHLTLRLEHRGQEVWRSVRGEPIPTAPRQHSYLSQHGIDEQSRLLP